MAQIPVDQETNGDSSTPRPGRPPKEGKVLPDETGIMLDGDTRLLMEDWITWYYPSGRVKNSLVVQEMIALAHSIAAEDQMRAETPEQRRGRLASKV